MIRIRWVRAAAAHGGAGAPPPPGQDTGEWVVIRGVFGFCVKVDIELGDAIFIVAAVFQVNGRLDANVGSLKSLKRSDGPRITQMARIGTEQSRRHRTFRQSLRSESIFVLLRYLLLTFSRRGATRSKKWSMSCALSRRVRSSARFFSIFERTSAPTCSISW